MSKATPCWKNQVLPLFLPASFTYFKFLEAISRQIAILVFSERFVSICDSQKVSADQSFVLSEQLRLVREGLPFNTEDTLHTSTLEISESGGMRMGGN